MEIQTRPCPVCLTNPIIFEQDSCVACHFKGDTFEYFLLSEERSNMLGRIREIPHVCSASVWHLGSSLFNLGIMLDDGRILAPGVGYQEGEQVVVQPAVPPLGVSWGVTVAIPTQTEDGVVQVTTPLPELCDDDELVELVAEIASGARIVELPPPPEPETSELITDELARTWVTGTGQLIGNVHTPDQCEGNPCPIHHPSEHVMAEWPTNWRERQISFIPAFTERICEHGNAHPDPDDRARWADRGVDLLATHTCECGCCDLAP